MSPHEALALLCDPRWTVAVTLLCVAGRAWLSDPVQMWWDGVAVEVAFARRWRRRATAV